MGAPSPAWYKHDLTSAQSWHLTRQAQSDGGGACGPFLLQTIPELRPRTGGGGPYVCDPASLSCTSVSGFCLSPWPTSSCFSRSAASDPLLSTKAWTQGVLAASNRPQPLLPPPIPQEPPSPLPTHSLSASWLPREPSVLKGFFHLLHPPRLQPLGTAAQGPR